MKRFIYSLICVLLLSPIYGGYSGGGDNLGSAIADKQLNLNGYSIVNSTSMTMTGMGIFISTQVSFGHIDPFGRPRFMLTSEGNFLKLGMFTSDGDPKNINSEGLAVCNPSTNRMSRIKADRFGLTQTVDSNLYYFRVDSSKLFFNKGASSTDKIIYSDGATGKTDFYYTVDHKNSNIVNVSTISFSDGTIMTSTANLGGNSSWVGTATSDLDMQTFNIVNVSSIINFGLGYASFIKEIRLSDTGVSIGNGCGIGGVDNVFMGNLSGNAAPNNTADVRYNTAVGAETLELLTDGEENSAFGDAAGYEIATGSYNSCFGSFAGANITNGNYNTVVGAQYINYSNYLDSYNICIGSDTAISLPANSSYVLNIGHLIYGDLQNKRIGIGAYPTSESLELSGGIKFGDGTVMTSTTGFGGGSSWIGTATTDLDMNSYKIKDTNDDEVEIDGNTIIKNNSATTLTVYNEDDNDSNIDIKATNQAESNLYFKLTDNSIRGAIKYSLQYEFMNFLVNGSQRMRINSAGQLGLNTTTPTSLFEVKNGSITVSGIDANIVVAGKVDGRKVSDLIQDESYTNQLDDKILRGLIWCNPNTTTTVNLASLNEIINVQLTQVGSNLLDVNLQTVGSTSFDINNSNLTLGASMYWMVIGK